jgi:hypothetical protein
VSARDAIAAASLAQVGGSVFFLMTGQTIARSAGLRRRGVALAGTIVLTGYERLAAVVVSFVLPLASGLPAEVRSRRAPAHHLARDAGGMQVDLVPVSD